MLGTGHAAGDHGAAGGQARGQDRSSGDAHGVLMSGCPVTGASLDARRAHARHRIDHDAAAERRHLGAGPPEPAECVDVLPAALDLIAASLQELEGAPHPRVRDPSSGRLGVAPERRQIQAGGSLPEPTTAFSYSTSTSSGARTVASATWLAAIPSNSKSACSRRLFASAILTAASRSSGRASRAAIAGDTRASADRRFHSARHSDPAHRGPRSRRRRPSLRRPLTTTTARARARRRHPAIRPGSDEPRAHRPGRRRDVVRAGLPSLSEFESERPVAPRVDPKARPQIADGKARRRARTQQ